jgi:hypothetical protein
VAQRANQVMGFDATGNVQVFSTAPAGVISSAMAPVVGAASIPLGRTALGLGAMATENIGGGLADDGASNARVVLPIAIVNLSTTITSANYLQKIKATGPITLTLPRGNTLFSGFGFWLEVLPQSTGPVTIAINAADQIENQPSGASITAQPGTWGYFCTNAATNAIWFLEVARGATGSAPPPGTYTGGLSIDVATNTTATASIGSVVVTDGLYFWTVTPTGGINTGTVGAGGIDVGPLANNTFYNVWVIYGMLAGTASWIISLASTLAALKPNLPAGYTAGARLGVLKTAPASTSLMGTIQRGNSVEYIPGLAQTTPGVPQVGSGIQTNQSIALTSVVPLNAKSYRIYVSAPAITIASENNASVSPAGYGALGTTNPPPVAISNQQSGTVGFAAASSSGTFIGTGPVIYNSTWTGSAVFISGFDLNL